MRVDYNVMKNEFVSVLEKYGLGGEDGELCARLFASSSLDGVYSHGLNRFPSFIRSIESGIVDVERRAVRTLSLGALERWDGQKGPGPLNAASATEGCRTRASVQRRRRGTREYQSLDEGRQLRHYGG